MITLDHELLLLINGAHTAFLDSLMWLISGKAVWVPLYLSILYIVWKNRGWKGVVHLLLLIGVLMLFTDTLNSMCIRPMFHRLRPANPDSPVGEMVHIVNGYRGGKYGFPSAHAANYWGMTLLIYYIIRCKRLLLSMTTLTILVCYSRAYLGVHYPGDLLAGIIYATLCVGLIVWLHKSLILSRKKAWLLPPCDKPCLTYLPGLTALITIAVFAVWSLFT